MKTVSQGGAVADCKPLQPAVVPPCGMVPPLFLPLVPPWGNYCHFLPDVIDLYRVALVLILGVEFSRG